MARRLSRPDSDEPLHARRKFTEENSEQPLMEPERKSSARNCCCETVARRYETAHVADSQRSLDPLFKRSRTIAKGGGLRSILQGC